MKFALFLLLALPFGFWKTISSGPDVTPPTLSSATVNGSVLTLNWSEAVTGASGYLAALDVDLSVTGSNIAVSSHTSGNGTATWVMALASPAVQSDTANLDFAGGANLIEDAAGNDAVAIADKPVTNSTTGPIFFNETFEGPGFVQTWAGTISGPSYATSPAPLIGSYSGRQIDTDGSIMATMPSDQSEIWGKATLHMQSVMINAPIIQFWDAAGSADTDMVGYIQQQSTSSGRWLVRYGKDLSMAGSAGNSASATAVLAQTYYIWWHWKSTTGGGADGLLSFKFNTTDNFAGATTISSADGIGSAKTLRRIQLLNGRTGATIIWDNVQMGTAEIQ